MPVQQSIALLKQGWSFVREKDLRTVARAAHSKDAHPAIQFMKYAVCGGLAAVATLAGLAAGPLLIKPLGIPTLLSQGTLIVTAVLVNYVCRKFIVFHG